MPYNWSMQAIPAAFLFGIVPHGYYMTRLMIATKNQMSNAMCVGSLLPKENHS